MLRKTSSRVALAVAAAMAASLPLLPAQAAGETDGQNVVAYGDALSAFEHAFGPNAALKDKAAATAALKQMGQIAPSVKQDMRALFNNLQSSGKAKDFDAQILDLDRREGLPPRLIQMVQSAGGPLKVIENASRFIDEDLARRHRAAGLPKTASETVKEWLAVLDPIGTANASLFGTGCSIVAWVVHTGCSATGSEACKEKVKDLNREICID
jgi:hypothetical protein